MSKEVLALRLALEFIAAGTRITNAIVAARASGRRFGDDPDDLQALRDASADSRAKLVESIERAEQEGR